MRGRKNYILFFLSVTIYLILNTDVGLDFLHQILQYKTLTLVISIIYKFIFKVKILDKI